MAIKRSIDRVLSKFITIECSTIATVTLRKENNYGKNSNQKKMVGQAVRIINSTKKSKE